MRRYGSTPMRKPQRIVRKPTLALTLLRHGPILQERDAARAIWLVSRRESTGPRWGSSSAMSRVKMRCPMCNKSFKSSDSKQTLCPDCLAKERLARGRGGPQAAKAAQPARVVAPAPLIVQAPPPPDIGAFGSAARRAEEDQRPHGPT